MVPSKPGWIVAIGVAFLASIAPLSAAVAAKTPQATQISARAPVPENVRALEAEFQLLRSSPPRAHAPARRLPQALDASNTPSLESAGPLWAGSTRRVALASPGFNERVAFAGLADTATSASAGPDIEPPDPWVAAGPNHVVQAVNT